MDNLRKSYLVLGIAMCLLMNNSHGQPSRVSTLYCQNMSLKVKGDQVNVTRATPTIYSLVRIKGHKDNNTSNTTTSDDNGIKISIESIATGKSICMSSKGRVYAVDTRKLQKAERRRKRPNNLGGTPAKSLLPKNCLFKKFKFSVYSTYRPAIGIYSPAHSNTTSGLFLAFNENGKVRGVHEEMTTLNREENEWIKLEVVAATNKFISDYLDKTSFVKFSKTSVNFNNRVRNCIRRESPLFLAKNDTNNPSEARGESSKDLLKTVIPKCKRKVESNMKNKGLKKMDKKSKYFEKAVSNEIVVDKVDNKPIPIPDTDEKLHLKLSLLSQN